MSEQNIGHIVSESAARLGDKPALIFHDRSVSYAQLDAAITRASAGVASLGVRKGDRVALMVHNTPEFAEAYFGIARAGGVVVPLNTMYTVEEVSYILADAEARAIIVAEPFIGSVGGLLQTQPMLEHVVVVGDEAPVGTMTWRQFASKEKRPP